MAHSPRHRCESKSRACIAVISAEFGHSCLVSIRPTPGRIAASARALLPWKNDEGDVTRIDDISLEKSIDYLAVTFIISLVGLAVLTLPTPRQPDQTPFGVQIIAAPGQESKLFAFGRRIEEQFGFCHRWPPI
jgi:amidase